MYYNICVLFRPKETVRGKSHINASGSRSSHRIAMCPSGWSATAPDLLAPGWAASSN